MSVLEKAPPIFPPCQIVDSSGERWWGYRYPMKSVKDISLGGSAWLFIPRHPNTCWEGIWTPKHTWHTFSGVIWMSKSLLRFSIKNPLPEPFSVWTNMCSLVTPGTPLHWASRNGHVKVRTLKYSCRCRRSRGHGMMKYSGIQGSNNANDMVFLVSSPKHKSNV